MKMMNELKPCPFCGGKPRIRDTGKDKLSYWVVDKMRIVMVECRKCWAMGGIFPTKNGVKKAKEDAIKAWNRRANDEN